MINYNSPIMSAFNQQQNVPNQQMYQQPYIPQPIGNMVNMGIGYNQPFNPMMGMGQYYGGVQTGIYNPYLIQQRQRQLEAQMRQEQIQNSNQFKEMSRRINKALGTHQDDIEEHVKRYDPQFIRQDHLSEEEMEDLKLSRLVRIDQQNIQNTPYDMSVYNSMMQERQRVSNEIPEDMGLSDFFESYSQEAIRLQEIELRNQQRQLNRLYNSSQYNKLLNMHNTQSSYFNSIYNNSQKMKNTSIDDMEISVPTSVLQNLERRKMEFLNSIPRV